MLARTKTKLNMNVRLSSLAAVLMLSACAQLSDVQQTELDTLPQSVTDKRWQTTEMTALNWSDLVKDEQLQKLINDAIANNPALQASTARSKAALAGARASTGPLWPGLDLGVNRRRDGNDNGHSDNYSASLSSSWEIDVWGRVRNSASAAKAGAMQQQALLQWARYSLAANAGKLWIESIENQRQWQLALQREKNLRDNLDIIEDGFRSGIRPALDVYSARAEFAASQSNTVNRERLFRQSRRQLNSLLGRAPEAALAIPESLPGITPAPSHALNLQALSRRPDVKAGRHALDAQLANLHVAQTNRLPRLSISAQYGAGNQDSLSDALSGDDLLWNAVGNLTAPLFRGGQLQAEQQRQKALLDATLADYKEDVINAVREVEQALDNEVLLSRQYQAAAEADRTANQAQNQAFESYVAGLSNLNTWLQAQRLAFDRRSQYMTLEAQRLSNRIDMYLALGGAFSSSEEDQ
jgi:NodT family efflux transporter outer membrane factor (OMF) lipoprotein